MKIGEIVRDSLSYPFSDWKKVLIFGLIILITSFPTLINRYTSINATDVTLLWIFAIVSFLIFFFERGYTFRIIKSSLRGSMELPEFINWTGMFIDGIKIFIVSFVYGIPVFLIIIVYSVLSFISNPSLVINTLSGATFWYFVGGTGFTALSSWLGILFSIIILYIIIIFPIILIAITHMAHNNSKLIYAFRFHEIIDKISILRWKNLIIWYLTTGIVLLIITFFVIAIFGLISGLIVAFGLGTLKQTYIVNDVLLSLIVIPYLLMFISRSLALFYNSE
jgi:hypothetical protein